MQVTLAALEWAKVLKLVAFFAKTSAGRQEVLQTVPEFGPSGQATYQLAQDVAALVEKQGSLPFSGLQALPLLAAPPTAWQPQELVQLKRLVRTVEEVRQAVLSTEPGPKLASLILELPQLGGFLAWCEQRLDDAGNVPDSASPMLAQLRKNREHVKANLLQQLTALARQYPFASGPYTLRRERFCFPIPSHERAKVPGLVLDASGSGATLFVEPFSLVELNNAFSQLQAQIREEEDRVLSELTTAFVRRRGELLGACGILAKLDAFQARILYGKASGGILLPPGHGHTFRVVGARHPLLDPALAHLRQEVLGEAGNRLFVVPTSLDFPPGVRLILISGPNAGGKTVALKTVGLLVLMATAGIPVLAEPGTSLPELCGVFCHIGDEQDVLSELSTFQAAMKATAELLARDDASMLVLYDELGSGTDPEEGQALAAALLEELARRGWWTLATSHLTMLSAHVEGIPNAANAAMGFDESTGSPTYNLLLGRPGRSRGLALAKACGLPAEVLARAEALRSQGARTLETYLARLDAETLALAEAREQLKEAEKALRAAELAANQRAKALEVKEQQVRAALQREVANLREVARKKWDEVLQELEKAKEEGKTLGRRRLAALRTQALTLELPEPPRRAEDLQIRQGDAVRVRGIPGQGKVLQLRGEHVEVAFGGKRLWVAKGECENGAAFTTKSELTVVATGSAQELVLVGLDREEARQRLEKFLDSALLEGHRQVRIVHGHGTGALRRTVWEVLQSFPGVVRFAHPPQFRGGTGVTEVELEG